MLGLFCHIAGLFWSPLTSDFLFCNTGLATELLTVQFRMHPALADFSSANFYNGCLASHPAPEDRPQPPGFPWPLPHLPFAFVNVRQVIILVYRIYICYICIHTYICHYIPTVHVCSLYIIAYTDIHSFSFTFPASAPAECDCCRVSGLDWCMSKETCSETQLFCSWFFFEI